MQTHVSSRPGSFSISTHTYLLVGLWLYMCLLNAYMENCQFADEAIFIWVKGSMNAWQNVISRSGGYGNDAQVTTKS